MAKFFPEGRALTAQIEEQLWDELIGLGRMPRPPSSTINISAAGAPSTNCWPATIG